MGSVKQDGTRIHHFCSGGGCCPVLVEHPDGHLEIAEDGETKVELPAELAEGLALKLIELGYGRSTR